jgi:hypothetical protein
MSLRKKVLIPILTLTLLLSKETGMAQPINTSTSQWLDPYQQPVMPHLSQRKLPSFETIQGTNYSTLPTYTQLLKSNKALSGDEAINRVEQIYGVPLTPEQKRILSKEGWSETWYRDTEGVPTIGMGQTALQKNKQGSLTKDERYDLLSPMEVVDQKLDKLNNIMGKTVMSDPTRRLALLDAYYRGDLSTEYNWHKIYKNYVEEKDPAKKQQLKIDAYEAVWDSNEYRDRMARIQAGKEIEGDVGVMNRVKNWMTELYGTDIPPQKIQKEIDKIASSL